MSMPYLVDGESGLDPNFRLKKFRVLLSSYL